MRLIRGVELLDQPIRTDARGDLVALEAEDMPFALARVFFMKVDAPDTVRGGHANSCHELIITLAGAVTVEVDNGEARIEVRLSHYGQALWIGPGVLIMLRAFAPGTILLVCASQAYVQTQHFDCPQPQLLQSAFAA